MDLKVFIVLAIAIRNGRIPNEYLFILIWNLNLKGDFFFSLIYYIEKVYPKNLDFKLEINFFLLLFL